MFTPLAALSDKAIRITGSGSLRNRPLDFFDEVLPQLHVTVDSHDGKLPLHIKGPLLPADITVDGSLSSQFLTGLLMAYSAASAGGVTIRVHDLKSKPYIDLTLQVMADFGLAVPQNHNYETFFFPPGMQHKTGRIVYHVEGDWSSAALMMVAGAVAGNITVRGIDAFTTQADKAILQALGDTGCRLSIEAGQVTVAAVPQLKAFHFNATDCPDLFPPLVALAACCYGTSVIEGIHRLAHKESNRALTLQQEFGKLGIDIRFQDDLMLVKGAPAIGNATVSSHGDHRVAMACAIAALRAGAPVTITGAEAVNKSYPSFFNDLQLLGVVCNLTE
jgi:3-phosphoshikimate 1-carboxyvinyltransferase